MKTYLYSIIFFLVGFFSWSSSIAQDHTNSTQGLSIAVELDALENETTVLQAPSTGPMEQDRAGTKFSLPEEFNGKKEMLDKRDMTSKHFLNEDGSFSAVLAAGPIHYKENGQWKDIDHKIKATSDAVYSYANTTNLFGSYFGTSSVHGVKSRTEQGEVREFLNGKMYWELSKCRQGVLQ